MKNKIKYLMLVLLSPFLLSCASKPSDEIPLWTNYETIEAIYPNSEYIARIGYAESAVTAAAMAESELGSYFSHKVHTVVKGNQFLSDTKNGNKENSKISRTIERTVSVESLHELFDVRKTLPWYDKAKKRYICCSYINRSDAWKIYETKLCDSCSNFHIYYNDANRETEIIKRIRLYEESKNAANDFLDKLEFARLILPNSINNFANERKLAEEVQIQKEKAQRNSIFFIETRNDSEDNLNALINQFITSENFNVTNTMDESSYTILVVLDLVKTVFDETMVVNPSISINIKSKITGNTIFTYKRNLPKQSGFSAAEKLIIHKVINSAENTLQRDFILEFRKIYE